MVRAGRVTVNDEVVDFPRQKLEPDAVVAVDGDVVEMRPLRYVLLNKPRGVASTRSDPHADKVVVDAVPDGRTLFPVGRLDVQTTGLIILTNDGALAHRLMHPSYGVPKTYVVRVRGRIGKRALATLRTGIQLEDGMTAPAEARLLKQSAKTALVELTIHQGRKRQVRRMFTSLGLTVDELHRRRYGPLSDADLAVGSWRDLREDELEALRRAAEHVDACVDEEPEEHGVTLAAEVPESAATDAGDHGPVDEVSARDVAGDGGDAKGAEPAKEMPAEPVEEMPVQDADADQGALGGEPDDRRAERPDGEQGDRPDAD
jgi:23S rRNA pseudouridine2605 synthase